MDMNAAGIWEYESIVSSKMKLWKVIEKVSGYPTIMRNRVFLPDYGKGYKVMEKEKMEYRYSIEDIMTKFTFPETFISLVSLDGTYRIRRLKDGEIIKEFSNSLVLGVGSQDNDAIITRSQDLRYIVKLDVDTNKELWQYLLPEGLMTRTAIRVLGEYVVFTDYANFICCLDSNEGNLLWKKETSTLTDNFCEKNGLIYIGINQNTLLFSYKKGYLFALDITNGQHQWTYKSIDVAPTIWPDSKGFVYLFENNYSQRKIAYCRLSIEDGNTEYLWDLEQTLRQLGLEAKDYRIGASCPAQSDVFFTLQFSDHLIGVNKETGDVSFSFKNNCNTVNAKLPIDEGRIYLNDDQGKLLIFE